MHCKAVPTSALPCLVSKLSGDELLFCNTFVEMIFAFLPSDTHSATIVLLLTLIWQRQAYFPLSAAWPHTVRLVNLLLCCIYFAGSLLYCVQLNRLTLTTLQAKRHSNTRQLNQQVASVTRSSRILYT